MRCSVVIPCHGGADLTRRCVASLLAQADTTPSEIVLVDNASRDRTRDLVTLDPRVRVITLAENRGFAGGVGAGIRASRGDHVLVLNNDTQAAANLLAELRRALHSSPSIGAVAPVSNHVKGPARVAVGALGSEAAGRVAIAATLAAQPIAMQDVDTLAGLCLLVRRSTFDRVGLFDERFGHGNFEDDDLCLRLRLHGLRLVIARRAFLHHEGHATFRALGLDLRTEIERRRAQFVAKWRRDPAGRAVVAALAGDLLGAAAAATDARRVWPDWPDADWHLARRDAALGDHAAAARRLQTLLQRCPLHSDAALALTEALLRSGDGTAGRAQAARTAMAFHLDVAQQVRLLTALGEHDYTQQRPAAAAAHFTAALELQPDDASLQNWLGLCHLDTGDLTAAERAFETAAAAGYALAHTNLGICHHRRGDDDGAERCFERAVELLPADGTARRNLAALRSRRALR
mgnify:CR=1 FL=1